MESKPTKPRAELGASLSSTTPKLWALAKPWALVCLRSYLPLPMHHRLPDGWSHFLLVLRLPVLPPVLAR